MESNVNISDSSGRKPLIGLTLQGLREVAARCGMPAFAAKQMARRLYAVSYTHLDVYKRQAWAR